MSSKPGTCLRLGRLCSIPARSVISLLCGCALLVFVFLSALVAPNAGSPVQLRRAAPSNAFPSRVLSQDLQPVPSQQAASVWETRDAHSYYGCCQTQEPHERAVSEDRYLMIDTSGGLNQQRTGITDAVVVAKLLNATLVVPNLDHNSYWKDSSNFSDIFDTERFIQSLAPDIPIVKSLPPSIKLPKKGTRVPRRCTPEFYQNKTLPVLIKKQALRLSKFDYRLANVLHPELQKLRCRVNYHALQFTSPIQEMGRSLVKRVKQLSGRYIALHLRYEPDMLAFSGCYYGGGEKETQELGGIRKRWKSLHVKNPERERRNGKCPLTPEEVGVMLRALGFNNETYLYVASGEVYGGEASLAPLKELFPNLVTKETLATKEELQPFMQYSSRMAALDYIVSDESDVFVTNNNGNMARILAGRRRYFGHKRTIRPNTKKLGPLFQKRDSMAWDEFQAMVRAAQRGFMGEPNEMKAGRGVFYENPADCICQTGTDNTAAAAVLESYEDPHWTTETSDSSGGASGSSNTDFSSDLNGVDNGEELSPELQQLPSV